MVGREAGMAQHRVERGDGRPCRHASARAGVCEHGPSEPFREAMDRGAARAPARDDDAAHGVERRCERVDGSVIELGSLVDHRVPRTAIGSAIRQLTRLADKRIAERQVHVHRPRPASSRAERLGHCCALRATATRLGSLPTAPPHRRTTEPIRRRGAADRSSAAARDALQLGGTIGGRRDERDRALVRLDDRGMELDGRGAAAREDDCGPTGRQPDPERHERAAALVVVHVHARCEGRMPARPRAGSTSIRGTRPRR